jgi:NAD(P)-dependent dehydrogenase (short-subunit alcohol dehydrogenase family)
MRGGGGLSRKWTAQQMPSQAGRVAVVTGASGGLGLETAIALAAAGATVVMACRNPDKAAAALAQLRQRAPRADARAMALDLASLGSVRAFARAFKRRHARLDLLINNAGILGVPFARTVDGFESQMSVNHLGHFALTGLLIGRLLATPGARIVTVASLGHWLARLDLNDINYERSRYTPFLGYCNSKLANLLFTQELSRRLKVARADVVAVAAHPGGAATSIKQHINGPVGARVDQLLTPLMLRFFINTARQGALPALYAAAAPGVVNGGYYGPDGPIEFRGHPAKAALRPDARNPFAAQRLWQVSSQLTGVSFLG